MNGKTILAVVGSVLALFVIACKCEAQCVGGMCGGTRMVQRGDHLYNLTVRELQAVDPWYVQHAEPVRQQRFAGQPRYRAPRSNASCANGQCDAQRGRLFSFGGRFR